MGNDHAESYAIKGAAGLRCKFAIFADLRGSISKGFLYGLQKTAITTRARPVHGLEIGGELHVAQKRRHGDVSGKVWAKIFAALKRHGVELLPETGEHGAGARSILRHAQRPQN
jgi:hypothetical protein